jgi:superfamily II DNA or RNA helicase/SAM-dependent methyltransferase
MPSIKADNGSYKTDLQARMKLVISEIGRFPDDHTLREVPYWSSLLDMADDVYKGTNGESGLDGLYDDIGDDYLTRATVPFPSKDQMETATQILEKKKILVRDCAGSGKTAPAILGKYGLEQIDHDGGHINTLVVCPNFVASSWEAKISRYTNGEATSKVVTSANRVQALDDLAYGMERKEIDFGIVTYDAIFREMPSERFGSDSIAENEQFAEQEDQVPEDFMDVADRLLEMYSGNDTPFYLILDECHHAKNPNALRSQAVRKLALEADNLAALTGTIFPDSLDDIYELISIFDVDNFPTADHVRKAYDDNPRLIRLFLHRYGKDPAIQLNDIEGVPEIRDPENIWFGLSDDEMDVYYSLLEYHELGFGEKFVLLRLAATDASLVMPENYKGSDNVRKKLETLFDENPELRKKIERINEEGPSKYKELDKLVEQIMERGEKVVIFSKYREGITDELEKRYAEFGTCRIDGTVTADPGSSLFSDRDIQRLEFQTNPDKRIMVATRDSLREGQDLHAANNVIDIQQDLSPGYNDQGLGRVARRGQTKPVNHYLVMAEGTIDRGVYLTELGKREAISLVDRGLELTREQKSILERTRPTTQQPYIKQHLMNSKNVIRLMSGQMKGHGPEQNTQFLEVGENARIYAQSYNHNWIYTYSAHTARLMKRVIEELEEGGRLERIIDLGSGPATVSRILGRASVCIDMNKYQLEIGRRECNKLGFDIETIQQYIENLEGIETENSDLAVMSLVLHYGNAERGDRKRMLLEANRSLKKGRYLILTLPPSVLGGRGAHMLEQGIGKLGFELIRDRTGIARAIDAADSSFEVYAALCRKIESSPLGLYDNDDMNDLFMLDPGYAYVEPKNNGRNGPPPNGDALKEIHNQFEFVDSGHLLVPKSTITTIHDEQKKDDQQTKTMDLEKESESDLSTEQIMSILEKATRRKRRKKHE